MILYVISWSRLIRSRFLISYLPLLKQIPSSRSLLGKKWKQPSKYKTRTTITTQCFLHNANQPSVLNHLLVQKPDEGKPPVLLAVFLLRDIDIPNPSIPEKDWLRLSRNSTTWLKYFSKRYSRSPTVVRLETPSTFTLTILEKITYRATQDTTKIYLLVSGGSLPNRDILSKYHFFWKINDFQASLSLAFTPQKLQPRVAILLLCWLAANHCASAVAQSNSNIRGIVLTLIWKSRTLK